MKVERDAAALDPLARQRFPPSAKASSGRVGSRPNSDSSIAGSCTSSRARRPPAGDATHNTAAGLGLDAADAFRVLAREDLVHFDASGRPVMAYPFSATPRGHRVLIDGKHWVEAMCAIDALGIAPMLALPIEIYSRDRVSGGEIRVRLNPSEDAWWEPEQAVVLAGSACGEGPSFRGCCDVLNFFQSRENAERYLAENPSVSGHPTSLPEAIEAGRIVFGELLRED
jgi:Alkylmercury lyase